MDRSPVQPTHNYKLVQMDMKIPANCKLVDYLRKAFVEDQGDSFEALAIGDLDSDVYILYDGDTPVATGRIYKKENGYKIERVAVPQELGKKGFGKELMRRLVELVLPKLQKDEIIYLHGQVYAEGFYHKCGWKTISEQFIEDNIQHVKMQYVGFSK